MGFHKKDFHVLLSYLLHFVRAMFIRESNQLYFQLIIQMINYKNMYDRSKKSF